MRWPDDAKIPVCVPMLKGTGYLHESFYKDGASKFTHAWFAWANTLFGEFLWKVYRERPRVLG